MSENDLQTLMNLAEAIAEKKADGHLTIMRFTTGWKCMLCTPDLDSGSGRSQVRNLKMHDSVAGALLALVLLEQDTPGQKETTR